MRWTTSEDFSEESEYNLYQYTKGRNGKWKLENIDIQSDELYAIYTMVQLPNGNVLLGGSRKGNSGILVELKKPPLTAEVLRQNLDKLVE